MRAKRRVPRLVTGLLLAMGCATAAPAPRKGAPATRYRVGDFIVYRYSGAFTAEPVLLREEIVSQEGNRLEIDVTATRGEERRRWIQVVTDTPENQSGNVVDELYEVVGGERKRLDNPGNRELLRLYEWTVLTPDGPATETGSERRTIRLAGKAFDCEVRLGSIPWRGRPLRLETSRCPDLVWTHGPARFWEDGKGDVWRAEIVELGP